MSNLTVGRSRALRVSLACAVLGLGLSVLPAATSASTIVYQCGVAVCGVDPDTATPPFTIAAAGTAAGITRDGATVAWADGAGVYEKPVGGGATRTLYSGEVYDAPRISPDGSRAAWTVYFNPGSAGWFSYATTGPTTTSTVTSSTYQTTVGWAGNQPLVSFRGAADGSTKSVICAVNAGGPSCDTGELRAEDPSLQLAEPEGSPGGQGLVAIRGAIPSSFGAPVEGAIAIYSVSTHQLQRQITPGPGDSHPSFSADSTRVAFSRDGKIYVASALDGSGLREVATGTTPFWGGAATVPPAGGGEPPEGGGPPGGGNPPVGGNPPGDGGGPSHVAFVLRPLGKVPLAAFLAGRTQATVRCDAGCRLTARLLVSAKARRELGLEGATIATASGSRATGGRVKLRLRPTAEARTRLRRAHALTATITVTARPSQGAAKSTASRAVTVRR